MLYPSCLSISPTPHVDPFIKTKRLTWTSGISNSAEAELIDPSHTVTIAESEKQNKLIEDTPFL